jgi:cephalosporin-C deacetylase-like acetyl esterase
MKGFLTIVSILSFFMLGAQSQKADLIRIMASPVSDSYQYNIGERADFQVAIYKYGKLLKNAKINYTIAQEQMEPKIESTTTLKSGEGIIEGIALNDPGFVRLTIAYTEEGVMFSNTATAGIDVDNIETFTIKPSDFNRFWDKAIADARKVDLEPLLTRMPELDNEKNIAYHIRFNHTRKSYIYGILTVPRKDGKFPAVLHVPGAGVRPYKGADVGDEIISLQIGIHGVPVNLYESDIYENLRNGALRQYYWNRMDDRDEYYYKRVYTACVKAIDFIHTLPEFDGENIAVTGGSQGGALTIVTAALDDRVDAIAAYYPALSDLEGFVNGRAGGWPRLFEASFDFTEQKRMVSRYYDVVNFARDLTIPGYYAYGYNDNVCPASSIAAMLNEIDADKQVKIAYDAAHWMYPEIKREGKKWLFNYIKVNGY